MNKKLNQDFQHRRKTVLQLSWQEARAFFMKSESYCNLELPPYFTFDELLEPIHKILQDKKLCDIRNNFTLRSYDDINYKILGNKDGKYAWRSFKLIHPALYVSLVNQITIQENWQFICDRFEQFKMNGKIHCFSLPVVSMSDENGNCYRHCLS